MSLANKMTKKLVLAMLPVCAGITFSSQVNAEMQWSDFSLSYLSGNEYEVGDKSRKVLTIEHASGHSWGDNFFFAERTKSKNGTIENYYELAPRLSLGHLTGSDLSFGIVSDVFVATTWEQGEFFDNYLLGIGVSLAVPGFNYLTANVYQANNGEWDNDQMLTVTWGVPFKLGRAVFLYDGFLDWSSSSDSQAAEMNFTSQLKFNLGQVFETKQPVYLGIEYAYWTNKFGISGVDERSTSLLFKWHF